MVGHFNPPREATVLISMNAAATIALPPHHPISRFATDFMEYSALLEHGAIMMACFI